MELVWNVFLLNIKGACEVTGRDTEYPLAGLPIKLVLGVIHLLSSLRRSRETALLISSES